MHPRARAAAAALLTLAAAGCGGPGPGGEPLPGQARSAVRLLVTAPSGASPRVEAAFADAGGERRVGPGDLRGTAEVPAPHSAWIPVAGGGTLAVRVAVGGAPGEALGEGWLQLPLEVGWMWTVEALVYRPAAGVPAPPCFGCGAEARFPLRPSAAARIAAGDSLFLRAVRTPAPGRMPLPPA